MRKRRPARATGTGLRDEDSSVVWGVHGARSTIPLTVLKSLPAVILLAVHWRWRQSCWGRLLEVWVTGAHLGRGCVEALGSVGSVPCLIGVCVSVGCC